MQLCFVSSGGFSHLLAFLWRMMMAVSYPGTWRDPDGFSTVPACQITSGGAGWKVAVGFLIGGR